MIYRHLKQVFAILAMSVLAIPAAAVGKEMRIAFQAYTAYAPVLVAKQKGWIEEELAKAGQKDVTVSWVSFQSGPQINEALGSGAIDIASGIGDMPALLAKISGMNTKLIALVSTGPKSEALMVRSDSQIKTVKELKGKKVAAIRGGNLYQLLLLILNDAGMSISDIEFINLSPQDMVTALANKSIDAATLFEPLLTRAETSGMARVLRDGTGLVSGMQVIVASGQYATDNPAAVRAFLEAVRRGADELRAHPQEWAAQLAPVVGLKPDESAKAMTRFQWNPPLDAAMVAEVKRSMDFLVNNKFARGSIDVNQFVDNSLAPSK